MLYVNERVISKDGLAFAYKLALTKTDNLYLAMCDGNGFKQINDNFGHVVGDKVIKRISDILVQSVRQTDAVVRYGGDEFVLLILNADADAVKAKIQKLQEAVRRDEELLSLTKGRGVTISVGVVKHEYSAHPRLEDIIHDADRLLYAAKVKKPYYRLFWDSKLKRKEVELTEKHNRNNNLHRIYFDFLMQAALVENPSYHTELLRCTIRSLFRTHGRRVSQEIVLSDMLTLIRWSYEKNYKKFKKLIEDFAVNNSINQQEFEAKLKESFGEGFRYNLIA